MRVCVLLIFFSVMAVGEPAPVPAPEVPQRKDTGERVTPRLSWGPYDYLQRGFRNAPWINDPFYPEARMLKVTGLISDEMAFINDRWYRPGEKIEGYTIKSIRPEGVILARSTEILMLKLKE